MYTMTYGHARELPRVSGCALRSATRRAQGQCDSYPADAGEDGHGPAGPHSRQDQLEQGHGIVKALLERTERAVPTTNQ